MEASLGVVQKNELSPTNQAFGVRREAFGCSVFLHRRAVRRATARSASRGPSREVERCGCLERHGTRVSTRHPQVPKRLGTRCSFSSFCFWFFYSCSSSSRTGIRNRLTPSDQPGVWSRKGTFFGWNLLGIGPQTKNNHFKWMRWSLGKPCGMFVF